MLVKFVKGAGDKDCSLCTIKHLLFHAKHIVDSIECLIHKKIIEIKLEN